jgi:hypothetical protein
MVPDSHHSTFFMVAVVLDILVPIVPFVLWYDGIVSCLRAYSRNELEEMIGLLNSSAYQWNVGEDRSGFLPVTYVLGYPVLAMTRPDVV